MGCKMSDPLELGNLSIDQERFEVRVADKTANLTFVEFELLQQLVSHAGKVVTRRQLLLMVWNETNPERDRKLTVHLSRLRKKIRESWPWRIETVTKRGYVLTQVAAPTNKQSTQLERRSSTAGARTEILHFPRKGGRNG